MKSIFVENGRILGKCTRAPKFVLILMALFGHWPTYKNLRGNTGVMYKLNIILVTKHSTRCFITAYQIHEYNVEVLHGEQQFHVTYSQYSLFILNRIKRCLLLALIKCRKFCN